MWSTFGELTLLPKFIDYWTWLLMSFYSLLHVGFQNIFRHLCIPLLLVKYIIATLLLLFFWGISIEFLLLPRFNKLANYGLLFVLLIRFLLQSIISRFLSCFYRIPEYGNKAKSMNRIIQKMISWNFAENSCMDYYSP
jgi:hypothetical protein